MRKLLYLCILILAASSLWAQVEPSATGGPLSLDDVPNDDAPSCQRRRISDGVGIRKALKLRYAGIVFTPPTRTIFINPGNSGKVGDESYSFVPTLYLNKRSTRHSEVLSFSPGFTIYQHTSAT